MRFTIVMFVAGLLTLTGASAAPPPLVARRPIPLPGVNGRIDHLSFDASRNLLFVAALGNDSVEVVDVSAGTRVRSLSGFHEPQGLQALGDRQVVAVANGGSGALQLVDEQTLALTRRIALSDDADNVRYDASGKHVYVGHGSGALSAIDTSDWREAGRAALPGHPESFQLERSGPRVFVNVPQARQVAVVDRTAMRVIATWPVTAARANYPMALDEKGRRLFVGCREPATLLVLDTSSGRVTGSTPICGDTDDLFYDERRSRVYVSCGDGVVDVIDAGSRALTRIARVPTAPGARTSLFVPAQDRLYVAAPRRTTDAKVLVYVGGGE